MSEYRWIGEEFCSKTDISGQKQIFYFMNLFFFRDLKKQNKKKCKIRSISHFCYDRNVPRDLKEGPYNKNAKTLYKNQQYWE